MKQIQHVLMNSFGMACFFAYFFLILFRYTDVFFRSHFYAFIIFGALIVLLYVLASFLSDKLTAIGPFFLMLAASIFCIIGMALLEFSLTLVFNIVGGSLALVGLVLSSLVWGKNLGYYSHTERMPVLSAAFMLGAIFTALALSLVHEAMIVVGLAFPILSFLHLTTFKNTKDSYSFCDLKETRRSHQFAIRTLLTTGVTGYIWGIAFFLVSNTSHVENSLSTVPLCFSLPISIGCIICLIDSYRKRRISEEVLLRFFACAAMIAILPLPFVPLWVQALCGAYLFLVFTLDTVMCFSAMAETARFNQLSPYWVFGISLAYYFAGAILAYILFGWSFTNNLYPVEIIVSLCSVVLIVGMSDFAFQDNNYPGSETATEIVAANKSLASSEKRPALWQMKINYITEKYELTTRQSEVFRMLAKGRTAQFVAKEFYISFSTAKAHIHNIYTKLNIHSQQELIDLVENAPIDAQCDTAPPGVAKSQKTS